MNKLFAVLLGGKIRKNNLMEDHQLVFVVAKNEKEARKLGKQKWPEAESIHVDGTQLVHEVDGFQIVLKQNDGVSLQNQINNNYSE